MKDNAWLAIRRLRLRAWTGVDTGEESSAAVAESGLVGIWWMYNVIDSVSEAAWQEHPSGR